MKDNKATAHKLPTCLFYCYIQYSLRFLLSTRNLKTWTIDCSDYAARCEETRLQNVAWHWRRCCGRTVGRKLECRSLWARQDAHVCLRIVIQCLAGAEDMNTDWMEMMRRHTQTRWHRPCQCLMRWGLSPVQSLPRLPVPAWWGHSLHSSLRCIPANLQSDHWQDGDHSWPREKSLLFSGLKQFGEMSLLLLSRPGVDMK